MLPEFASPERIVIPEPSLSLITRLSPPVAADAVTVRSAFALDAPFQVRWLLQVLAEAADLTPQIGNSVSGYLLERPQAGSGIQAVLPGPSFTPVVARQVRPELLISERVARVD